MICTKVVKYVALNLYFVTLGDNLSLPMNLFHEDKSAAKVCPIEYDRFCVIAIYRMSRRTRITGNICYRQNSRVYNRYSYFGKYHCGFGSITGRFVIDFWPIVK